MNELIPINKIVSEMNISSRSLRYWESAGLFKSIRDKKSGWRLYDENAIQSIRLTELLRRLDISINDIKEILENKTADKMCEVLKKQLKNLNKIDSDLSIRKDAISELINVLNNESFYSLPILENILLPMKLERKKANIAKLKEGLNMENLNIYNEVRIVKLSPMRAAAYSWVSAEPEDKACSVVLEWIEANDLLGTMRLFGFNVDPYPTEESPVYGFGFCATIPEGIEIPNPLYEYRMPGGAYAVIDQYTGDPSHGWKKAVSLLADEKWEWEYDADRHPGFEEHIMRGDQSGYIIPILVPVRKKVKHS